MAKSPALPAAVPIESLIATFRGQRVLVDRDLACNYGVPTKRLNEAVRRNADRFPPDFLFQLNPDEAQTWLRSRSQFATLKRGSNIKYLPYAFTEHGAIMAANVLNSPRAVRMSVFVVRAFVKMRGLLLNQVDLAKKLAELEKKLTERLDLHGLVITDIIQQIMLLLNPPEEPEPPRKPMGFLAREGRAIYRAQRRKVR